MGPSKTWEIVYCESNGKDYYDEWYMKLVPETRALIDQHRNRLRLGTGRNKSVRGKLRELIIEEGAGYRVYYYRHSANELMIFTGSDKNKKNQQHAIDLAEKLMNAVEAQKKKQDKNANQGKK